MTSPKNEVGSFVREGDELVWRVVSTYALTDTGCVFLCYKRGDEPHQIYKLTKVSDGPYFWAGLWNSSVVRGKRPSKPRGEWKCNFDDVDSAIQAMIDDGHVVWRTHFDDMVKSIRDHVRVVP